MPPTKKPETMPTPATVNIPKKKRPTAPLVLRIRSVPGGYVIESVEPTTIEDDERALLIRDTRVASGTRSILSQIKAMVESWDATASIEQGIRHSVGASTPGGDFGSHSLAESDAEDDTDPEDDGPTLTGLTDD